MKYYFKCFKELYRLEQTSSRAFFLTSYFKAFKATRRIHHHNYELVRKYRLTPSYSINNFLYEYYVRRKRTELYKNLESLLAERRRMREGERASKFKQFIGMFADEDILSKIKTQVSSYYDKGLSILKSLKGGEDKEKIKIITSEIIQSRFQQYILSNVKLYHESLKAMIEGQREVLQNPEFKFEDGRTVKEKTDDFEKFIKTKMPRFKRKIEVNTENESKEGGKEGQ